MERGPPRRRPRRSPRRRASLGSRRPDQPDRDHRRHASRGRRRHMTARHKPVPGPHGWGDQSHLADRPAGREFRAYASRPEGLGDRRQTRLACLRRPRPRGRTASPDIAVPRRRMVNSAAGGIDPSAPSAGMTLPGPAGPRARPLYRNILSMAEVGPPASGHVPPLRKQQRRGHRPAKTRAPSRPLRFAASSGGSSLGMRNRVLNAIRPGPGMAGGRTAECAARPASIGVREGGRFRIGRRRLRSRLGRLARLRARPRAITCRRMPSRRGQGGRPSRRLARPRRRRTTPVGPETATSTPPSELAQLRQCDGRRPAGRTWCSENVRRDGQSTAPSRFTPQSPRPLDAVASRRLAGSAGPWQAPSSTRRRTRPWRAWLAWRGEANNAVIRQLGALFTQACTAGPDGLKGADPAAPSRGAESADLARPYAGFPSGAATAADGAGARLSTTSRADPLGADATRVAASPPVVDVDRSTGSRMLKYQVDTG